MVGSRPPPFRDLFRFLLLAALPAFFTCFLFSGFSFGKSFAERSEQTGRDEIQQDCII